MCNQGISVNEGINCIRIIHGKLLENTICTYFLIAIGPIVTAVNKSWGYKPRIKNSQISVDYRYLEKQNKKRTFKSTNFTHK